MVNSFSKTVSPRAPQFGLQYQYILVFLDEVPCIDRILMDKIFSSGLRQSYWIAPVGTTSAELIIVLGNLSDVYGVVLLVSPCGYSMSDSPTVSTKQESLSFV